MIVSSRFYGSLLVVAAGVAACSSGDSDEQGRLDAATSWDASDEDTADSGELDASTPTDGAIMEGDSDVRMDADVIAPGVDAGDEASVPDAGEDASAADAGEDASIPDAGEDASVGASRAWRTPVRISSDVDGDVFGLEVGFGQAGGTAVAVWSAFPAGASFKTIWANVFVVGVGWGNPTRIDALDQNAERPRVALDGLGNAFVVWEQSDGLPTADGVGARYNIWQNRYVQGTGWIGADLLEELDGESYAINLAGSQRVAASTNGSAHAVWSQGTPGNVSVWESRFTPGAGWSDAALADSTTASVGPPNVAMDASGNSTVVWTQLTGANFNAWARINGGSPTQVDTNVGHNPSSLAVAMSGGNTVLAWRNGCSVWGNRATSGAWGAAMQLQNTANCAELRDLHVITDANALMTALWTRNTGASLAVYAAVSSPTSGWASTTFERAGVVHYYRAMNPAGQSLSTWNQGTSGTVYSTTQGEELATVIQQTNAHGPHIAMSADGHALTVFVSAETSGVRNAAWASSYE